MEDCLVRYFSINRECPLPGIGSLVAKEQQAVINIIEKRIQAPRSFVLFSNNELNDTSLLKLIQSEYDCDKEAAKARLSDFVKNITDLKPKESISLGALGTLRRNDINSYDIDVYAHSQVYGADIHAERLVKINAPHAILVGDRETTRHAMQEYFEANAPVWKSKWWIAAIIILLSSIALILTHYYYFNGNSRFGNHLGF